MKISVFCSVFQLVHRRQTMWTVGCRWTVQRQSQFHVGKLRPSLWYAMWTDWYEWKKNLNQIIPFKSTLERSTLTFARCGFCMRTSPPPLLRLYYILYELPKCIVWFLYTNIGPSPVHFLISGSTSIHFRLSSFTGHHE